MKYITAFIPVLSGSVAGSPNQQQPLIVSAQNKLPIPQPLLGFGTWNLKVSEDNTTEVVSLAIQTGYRQIDCAAVYGNEKAVGRGIADGLKKANLTRGDIWVTSKLWNDHHGDPSTVEAALDKTLEDLGLEYLDLYLMHWPLGISPDYKKFELDYVETWKSMLTLPKDRALNLGISNFSPSQLRQIISETGVTPSVHQMELHPYLQQSSWLAAHNALGISVTAYSPLGNANPIYSYKTSPPPLLENPIILSIASARNCTAAQVALAWNIGRGVSVIPKSTHEKYIVENYESEKCKLDHEDSTRLSFLGRRWLHRFSNPSERWGVRLFEGLDGV